MSLSEVRKTSNFLLKVLKNKDYDSTIKKMTDDEEQALDSVLQSLMRNPSLNIKKWGEAFEEYQKDVISKYGRGNKQRAIEYVRGYNFEP